MELLIGTPCLQSQLQELDVIPISGCNFAVTCDGVYNSYKFKISNSMISVIATTTTMKGVQVKSKLQKSNDLKIDDVHGIGLTTH